MLELTGIYRYPIKSTAGEPLKRVFVTTEGGRHDRRFMLVKPDGSFMTARRYPGLQRIEARFDGERLAVCHNDYPALAEAVSEFTKSSFETEAWSDRFTALTTTLRLDAWFSRIAAEPVHLLWLGERSRRYRPSINTRVSFADGHPLLLTSEASLDDLNQRTDDSHVMAQFRPNVVVRGLTAYAEDDIKRLRIGHVSFRVDSPCSRCAMVTVDPAKGQRREDGEPLRALARYRKGDNGNVYFGQNLVAENEGMISVDDRLTILT